MAIDSPRESIFQSTHPVWGATHGRHSPIQLADEFQSTHPVWGATQGPAGPQGPKGISIHAPRVGCDQGNRRQPPGRSDFNPRTPCGVRPTAARTRELSSRDFNPRTPCGVRPTLTLPSSRQLRISIHAPRVGCDWLPWYFSVSTPGFQSTHPVWGATCRSWVIIHPLGAISIHAPRVGCDLNAPVHGGQLASISIHAPRVGCDRCEYGAFA